MGFGGIAVLHTVGGDGLNHHETDVVSDNVVQFSCDACTFVGDCGMGGCRFGQGCGGEPFHKVALLRSAGVEQPSPCPGGEQHQ
jgi:hypothetical protein